MPPWDLGQVGAIQPRLLAAEGVRRKLHQGLPVASNAGKK
jgi:hypothetical protein